MNLRTMAVLTAGLLTAGLLGAPEAAAQAQYEVHDTSRPQPAKVDPGTASTQERAGQPPSDAVVLFGGDDLSEWASGEGGPAQWRVGDGYMEVVEDAGPISTRRGFGDVQLHVEWMAPTQIGGEGQGRGNSGIFLMDQYEVQVLDVYNNETYPDGQAAALYGQHPPLVNANRAPGQWQTYDIVFHRPRFDEAGVVEEPARVTVFHNGVLVQDNVRLMGPTGHYSRPQYEAHPDRLPISLQDHGDPVRYRNIWVRELE